MSWRKLLLCLLPLLILCPSGVAAASKKVLLIGQGPDGHPKGTHEYMAGVRILGKCLSKVPGLEVTVVQADGAWQEGPRLVAKADAVVLFLSEGARWVQADAARHRAFTNLAARKGGLVALHWAIGTKDAGPVAGYLKLLGGCHGGPDRKYTVVKAEVRVADPKHPITAGIGKFQVRDEFYYRLKFVKPQGSIHPLLQVSIAGQLETVAWSWERPGGGRSFGFSGLHFHANWREPAYRRLAAQAVLWVVQLPVPKEGLAVDIALADLKLN
jgi:type 1 glutamine amidotransferase